jgi:hypothetical protein
MKRQLGAALLAFVLLISCKKDSDDTTATTSGWKLGTTSYTTAFATRINTGSGTTPGIALTAMDAIPTSSNTSSLNTFVAYFSTAPTANGTYRVVAYPGTLSATQVGIVAGGPNGTYASTGAGTVDATITVSGGKITIVVPPVTVKKTTSAEELTASGTIKEN